MKLTAAALPSRAHMAKLMQSFIAETFLTVVRVCQIIYLNGGGKYETIARMNQKQRIVKFRKKLDRLLALESTACGHDELVEKAVQSRKDLIEFFKESIKDQIAAGEA